MNLHETPDYDCSSFLLDHAMHDIIWEGKIFDLMLPGLMFCTACCEQ